MAQGDADFDPFGDGGNPFADPETSAAPAPAPAALPQADAAPEAPSPFAEDAPSSSAVEATPSSSPVHAGGAEEADAKPMPGVGSSADPEYTCCDQLGMACTCVRGALDGCTTTVAASRRGVSLLSLLVAAACAGVVAYSVLFMLPFNFHGDCGLCGDPLGADTLACDADAWTGSTCAVFYALGGDQEVTSTGVCTDAAGDTVACQCSCYTACDNLPTALLPLRFKVATSTIEGGEAFHLGCPMPPTTNSLRVGGAAVAGLWMLGMALGVLCLDAARGWLLALTSSVISGIAMLFLFGTALDSQAVAESQAACSDSFADFPWPLGRNNLFLFGVDRQNIECDLFPFAWLPVMDIALAFTLAWVSAVFVTRYKLQAVKHAVASPVVEDPESQVPEWGAAAAQV